MLTVTWRGHFLGILAGTLPAGSRWAHVYQPRSTPGTPRPPQRTIHGAVEAGDEGLRLVLLDRCPLQDAAAVAGVRGFMPSRDFAPLVRAGRAPITIERRVPRETKKAAAKSRWPRPSLGMKRP